MTTQTKHQKQGLLAGWRDAMSQSKDRREAKITGKALRRNPDAQWLYYTTPSGMEVNLLLAHGWEVVSEVPTAPVRGTSITTQTRLRKRNPTLP